MSETELNNENKEKRIPMKKFDRPYLKVINLDDHDAVGTACVIECHCNTVSCTCNDVCGCVGDCEIYVSPSVQP